MMKKITLLNRVTLIAILQLCVLMGASANNWGCISLPGGGLSGIDCGILVNETGKITIETWVLGSTTDAVICSNYDDDSKGFNWIWNVWGDFQYQDQGGWFNYYSADDVSISKTWQHLAIVVDGTSIVAYLNGVQVKSIACTKPFVSSILNHLLIGRNNWNADSGVKIKYSDFRIWNTARTADQISANFQSHVPINSPGLLINYTFDEQAGNSTINLASPTNNLGTLNDVQNVGYEWGKMNVVPSNLVVTNKTATGFILSWNGGWDNQWEVELDDPDGGGLTDSKSISTDTITDLTANSYTVKVRATYPLTSDWSAPITVNLTTGIEKTEVYNLTLVNQNGQISINNLEGENNIVVYSTTGSMIKQFKSIESLYRIDATNWIKGLYIINVKNDTKNKVFKVTI